MTLAVLRKFVLSVVRDEYPAIKAMKWESNYQPCLATQGFLNDFLASIRLIAPSTLQEQSLFNEILKHASSLEMSRVQRRLSAQSDLPGVLWAVVVVGGLITLGFVALFGHKNKRQHLLLWAMLALEVGGAISVIVILNSPFSGDIGINPDGYNYLIELAGWNKG